MMDGQTPTTEFNMSVMTLGRINYSLLLCSEHRRNMELRSWFFELQNLYIESSSEIKGNLKSVVNKYFNENDDKVSDDDFQEIEKFIDRIETSVGNYEGNPSKTKELFKMLMALEMTLRKTLKDSGLLMKMKDDLFTPMQKWE